MSDYRQLLKSKRESIGMSQKKLAEICGLHDTDIHRIENGEKKNPKWEQLCQIANALEISPIEILISAGYMKESEVTPCSLLCGVTELDADDIKDLQVFVNYLRYRKSTVSNKREG